MENQPNREPNPPTPRPRRRRRKRKLPGALPLVLAALVVISVIFAFCRLLPDVRQTAPSTAATLPPPDANSFAPTDFYREGEFIQCSAADCLVGVDVSSHQKDIDWNAVAAAGVDYAMIRVGYRGYDLGGLYVDENWEQNVTGALAAGLEVGVYFYSQAISVEEALEEAELVLENIRGYDITFPVVFDWECVGAEARTYNASSRLVTDCTAAFCDAIEDAGYRAMFYFNQSMAMDTFRLRELKDYDFWLAQYADAMTFAYEVQMWQYTNKGQIPGIAGNVDLNLSFVHYGERT